MLLVHNFFDSFGLCRKVVACNGDSFCLRLLKEHALACIPQHVSLYPFSTIPMAEARQYCQQEQDSADCARDACTVLSVCLHGRCSSRSHDALHEGIPCVTQFLDNTLS